MAVIKKGGIPLSWLIDVTSTGVREAFSLSKLHTLAITKYNEQRPTDKMIEFYDSESVGKIFGFSSIEYKYSLNYFGVVNKLASKPDLLTIFNWNENATPACIIGAKASDLKILKTLNGKFKITLGASTKEVTLDLTQTNSYTDIALKIKDAIKTAHTDPSFTNNDVIYSNVTNGFIVKSGVSGDKSVIDFITAPGSGTNISNALGLTKEEGAVIVSGYNQEGSILNVLDTLNGDNGNYYVIDTTFDIEKDDAVDFANFINNSNDRFVGIYNTNDSTLIENDTALDTIKAFNGVIPNYFKDSSPIGFVAGIISSIDFARTGGNLNLAFNDATKFDAIAINDKNALNMLEKNNANSILKFGQMGQSQVWYGMGNILGIKTNSANVYIANSYLMFSLQYALANLLNTQGFIGLRGTFNNGLIINSVSDVFNRAVLSGIIVNGAVLTDTEKQVVISTFRDNSEVAIKQMQDNGFYFEIGKVDISKQTLQIVTAYVANKNLKRIVINNYILGA